MFEYIRLVLALAAGALVACGCSAHYVNRGRPADLGLLMQDEESRDAASDERTAEDLTLRGILARRPTAGFPTSIAVVRLQARDEERRPSYPAAKRVERFSDRFAIVTHRDVETTEALQRLRELPEVTSVAGVNQLLVPQRVDTEADLRKIAAQLRADMLLLYTLDTHEELDDESPLFSLLTLGILPTHEIEVRTTASAVLLDTRTGYCYGVAEGTAFQDPHTTYWTWQEKTDDTRLAVEREAFAELVDRFAETWTRVVATHASPTKDDVLPTQ